MPAMETEVGCVACPWAPTWMLRIESLGATGHGNGVLVLVQVVGAGVEECVTEICLAAMPECLGCTGRSNLAKPCATSKTVEVAM